MGGLDQLAVHLENLRQNEAAQNRAYVEANLPRHEYQMPESDLGSSRLAEALNKAGAVITAGLDLVVGDAEASDVYAGAMPHPDDLYDPRGPEVSPDRFKETIAKESQGQYVWVMYDQQLPEDLRVKADNFWNLLKEEFQAEVASYIRIDTDLWEDKQIEAAKIIGKNKFPGYVLFRDGKVVRDKNNEIVSIPGAPEGDLAKEWVEYIRTDTPLK